MQIGIDASRYNNEMATGVEHYGRQIINHMLPLFKKEDEIILYSRFALEGEKITEHKNQVIYSKRFWTLKALSKEIATNPPDALFIPSHVLPLKLAERSVITVHDLAFKRFRNVYSFVQYNYLNWSTKMAVRKAAKIIVPSKATRDDLIEFYRCAPGKIEVVHHGFTEPKSFDEEKVRKESPVFEYFPFDKDCKYILFVGRLESKKNLVRLVQAFAKLRDEHPDYKLVLAGKRGVGFKKIWKEVKKLGLDHEVWMPGYITEEEKSILYRGASIFAFPSLYEGFGLPILEAFHHKVPVLCSSVSSLPEVCADAAEMVDPHDVDSIANGLLKLAKNEGLRRELVENGTNRLKDFSWEKAAAATVKCIYG